MMMMIMMEVIIPFIAKEYTMLGIYQALSPLCSHFLWFNPYHHFSACPPLPPLSWWPRFSRNLGSCSYWETTVSRDNAGGLLERCRGPIFATWTRTGCQISPGGKGLSPEECHHFTIWKMNGIPGLLHIQSRDETCRLIEDILSSSKMVDKQGQSRTKEGLGRCRSW